MPSSGEAIEYVVLVCQWRHPPERFTLELPSGAVDPGGKQEEAAPGAFEETGSIAEELDI